MSENRIFALMIAGMASLAACNVDPLANEQNGAADEQDEMAADEQDGVRAESNGTQQQTESTVFIDQVDIERGKRVSGLDSRYSLSEMKNAFHSIFKRDEFATIRLPRSTKFTFVGEIIPFTVAPAAFEWIDDDGAILVTAASNEYDSAAILPNSDFNYIGIYYLQPDNLGFKVKAAYPTALRYLGGDIPHLSRRFTGKPVLVAGGIGSFTHMGQSRYWDELYELNGGKPKIIAVIPRECGQPIPDHPDFADEETSGEIAEIQTNKSFTVEYRGDRSGRAHWDLRNGRYVLTARFPDICDHDYPLNN